MFRFDVFKIIGNFFYDSDFLYQYRFHHSFFTEYSSFHHYRIMDYKKGFSYFRELIVGLVPSNV